MQKIEEKFLPVYYRIEFHEKSIINDAFHELEILSPISVAIGDKINPIDLGNHNLESGYVFRVIEIRHIFTTIIPSAIRHILSVVVVPVKDDV
ncbi:hypothetical protein [Bathymodiolus japonicus methanotrophic gill symbiont]|uniref:hypothetical protein n=1 Tax=Bathymodiolus japonicus methanotrophic gill symbiont TaxID=113269 RepID=UPI001C8DA404|nr:hypothetical protein [Bathymodiolus japonicus methanotrophic gill symbiont]